MMSFYVPENMNWLRATLPLRLASGVKWAVIQAYSPLNRVIRLEPEKRTSGRVLISYYVRPYLLDLAKPIPKSHPVYWHASYWASTEMARSFLERGYAVDVIDCTNTKFIPRDTYEIFLDCRHNMERLTPLLPKECLKIFHIDVAHSLFHNAAECQRLLALQRRRGVTLRNRRFETPNLGIEYADCATVMGNEFTMNTFRYANKPMYPIPGTGSHSVLYEWPEGKNFEDCRRSYLWLGSDAFVRKGLDLVLDVFARMPQYRLSVCGPVHEDQDFVSAYHKELFETPNIRTIGWVDVGSREFADITTQCIGLICPSCCEGQCGAVITCLHAGLIPIASYESGVDLNGFGVTLMDCSIEEITRSIEMISSLPAAELQTMARKGWEYARENHSRDCFAREWRRALGAILEEHVAHRATASVTVG
jgi:glycosyltransferase involved in cell wall biosynthesis